MQELDRDRYMTHQARSSTDGQRAGLLADAFVNRLNPTGPAGVRQLLEVAQSQAYFTTKSTKLGILSEYADFFEFDPNDPLQDVRAVAFDFTDGPDMLELVVKSISPVGSTLWVPYVLNNSSSGCFESPTSAMKALVAALVEAAPSLSASKALVTFDARDIGRYKGAPLPDDDAVVQTLLVIVTVTFDTENGPEAAVRVCRIYGANLLCGSENCLYHGLTARSARSVCRLCHGMYTCRASADGKGSCYSSSITHHKSVCGAIRATHRAWHGYPVVSPKYIVPRSEELWEEDLQLLPPPPPPPTEDDAAANGGGGDDNAPAAAVAIFVSPRSPGDVSTDDEAVDDTQPMGDDFPEVVLETPRGDTNTTARELFAAASPEDLVE